MLSTTGFRLLDVRRQVLNVWEPSALVRRKDTDRSTSTGASEMRTFSTAPSHLVQTFMTSTKNLITAMTTNNSGRFIFCGRQNGSVSVHDASRSGREMQHLFNHEGSVITCLHWDESSNLLVSCDTASHIMAHQVKAYNERSTTGTRERWSVKRVVTHHLNKLEPVRRVLSSMPSKYILVSTTRTDFMFNLSGHLISEQPNQQIAQTHPLHRQWGLIPNRKRCFLSLHAQGALTWSWKRDDDEPPRVEEIPIDIVGTQKLEVAFGGIHIASCDGNMWIMCEEGPRSEPVIWSTGSWSSQSTMTLLERFTAVAPAIKKIIGLHASQLVFLSMDDCIETMRLDDKATTHDGSVRRFPLPHCWHIHNDRQQPFLLVNQRGDIIVASGDQIVIVQRGLGR